MTREDFIAITSAIGHVDSSARYMSMREQLRMHDAEQRQVIERQAKEIERLNTDLSHWTFERYRQMESTIHTLREALEHARFTGHRFTVSDCSGCMEAQRVLKETKERGLYGLD